MITKLKNRRQQCFRGFLCFFSFFLLLSCASVEHYKDIDKAVFSGDYEKGFSLVEEARGKAYKDRDAVIFYLDAGMLAHYSGNYEKSSQYLQTGERSIEAAFTKSLSLAAGSFLVNDNVMEYSGEDYEDLYLNVFNALNYVHQGKTDGALVEVRRMDNKIKHLSTKYGTAITNAQKNLLENDTDIPYDKKAARIEFSNSALARYLGMLLYRTEGLVDDARIDRDQIKLAFANQRAVYSFPVPASINDELAIPRGKARINVLSFNGLSPHKVENVTRIPISGSNWIKISLPVFTPRPSRIDRTVVMLDTGESFELELLEDLGAIAAETFNQRAALIYLKTVIRSVAKTTSSAALGQGAGQTDDASASLLLSLLSLGTQIYADASEQADLRMSRYFPDRALVGGITVDPGVYTIVVIYYDSNNAVIQKLEFENFEVDSGRLNLLEAVCIQ
ncbi:MAG TPA: hypothetical protein GXZ47_04310 [Treponema sp.]|nr:hypothetical protein [Treponema sp.]